MTLRDALPADRPRTWRSNAASSTRRPRSLPRDRGPAAPGDRVRGDGRSRGTSWASAASSASSRAVENSVHDHRVDELIDMIERHLRAVRATAEGGGRRRATTALQQRLSDGAGRAWPRWWDKFATIEVSSSRASPASETLRIGRARGRGAAGLARGGHGRRRPGLLAAARRRVPLAQGLRPGRSRRCWTSAIRWPPWPCWCSGSARPRRFRWPRRTTRSTSWRCCGWKTCGSPRTSPAQPRSRPERPPAERWPLARKFLDYLEANAEEYWQVPRLRAGRRGRQPATRSCRGRRGRGGRRTSCSARPTKT